MRVDPINDSLTPINNQRCTRTNNCDEGVPDIGLTEDDLGDLLDTTPLDPDTENLVWESVINQSTCFVCGRNDRMFDSKLERTGHTVCSLCVTWSRENCIGAYAMESQSNILNNTSLTMDELKYLISKELVCYKETDNPHPQSKHKMKLYFTFQLALAVLSKSDSWWATLRSKRVERYRKYLPLLEPDCDDDDMLLISSMQKLSSISEARYIRRGGDRGSYVDSVGLEEWQDSLVMFKKAWEERDGTKAVDEAQRQKRKKRTLEYRSKALVALEKRNKPAIDGVFGTKHICEWVYKEDNIVECSGCNMTKEEYEI